MTERMRSQVQASEMRFLRRIEGVTLFNKVRSSEIGKSLNIEPLLLRIERSQLRWFGHVSKMPQERPVADLGGGMHPPTGLKVTILAEKQPLFRIIRLHFEMHPPHQPKRNESGRKIALNLGEDLFFFLFFFFWRTPDFGRKNCLNFPISAE